ncbi:NPCBM/NEW2 domain-containing protein [Botrimarina mediterranea]|uniref:Soluble aldose sugar dehydrogenase YliI n=1 Tax=Botrimarina mediterranea TaxID=2528022 RepID=A0A518K969_9BACT|nr:NPCBM/NEW2 domain-containing protein [Botrimarina mediterranea]QDV74348.1 Soluble aldose sugar dehydrogenase YliI precursor [Botrimarina mediterranea]
MRFRKHRGLLAARTLGAERLEDRRLLANVPAGFTETVLAAELTSPTTLDIDESGRVWVAYQDGRIEVLEPGASEPVFAHQLDADGSAEHGLQGLELDPDFENNHYVYVYYTANTPEPHNRLSRLTVDPTTENTILPGSEVPLLELPPLSEYGNPPWHIGGSVVFDAEGHLYVQIGESQQSAQSQDLESPLGKVFRLHSDGSIPTDNPYYNAADGVTWRDYIWASGLRNPFAGDLDPLTGRYLIADVGAGSWEEINDATQPGLNFGWPTTEGPFNDGQFPDFTEPLYGYPHTLGCAITGVAFTQPGANAFPESYQGKVFFAEFCSGQLLLIDPANPPAAGEATVFAKGADFPMNIEFGPDGSLYYISRGAGAGGAPGIGSGSVRKIAYAADVGPSIVVDPSDQLASVGYSTQMTVSAAGTSPLAYQWQVSSGGPYVDVPGANSATLNLNSVQLADSGKTYRAVVTNALGSAISAAATLTVTSDTPPTPHIVLPTEGAAYAAGDIITFSGFASDAEDGTLADSQLTWRVDFHHNVHSHPFIPPTTGVSGGEFQVPTATETDDNVWYRINLTVTDSAGLTSSTFVDVLPHKSEFVVQTNLPGGAGTLTIDGKEIDGPFTDRGVENVERTLKAPLTQSLGDGTAYFVQWLDGVTNNERTIFTPEDDTAYVALYRTYDEDFVYLSDLAPAETPVNGWGPVEFDSSNGEDDAGDGRSIRLNGVVYPKGLGVHANSEITYALDGQYARFVSDIGVDDEVGGGTVVFRVLVDGVEVYNSGTMTGASPTQAVDVSVVGASELKLIVDDNRDGNGEDHADWAGARLTQVSAEPLVNINFQVAGVAAPGGYLADTGLPYADHGAGWSYGWSSDHTDVSRDRDANTDPLLDTLVHFHAGGVWEIEVPNGEYLVTASVGDAGFPSNHTLNVEGTGYWAGQPLDANEFAETTRLVVVNDGRLTLDAGAAADKETRINFLEIAAVLDSGRLLPFTTSDVDLNGRLDLNDVAAFGAGWGADGSLLSLKERVSYGDVDFDGDTDVDDWNLFNARWLAENNAPLSFAAVIDPLAGDYDRSGAVTRADHAVWRASYGAAGQNAADGNGDGVVNAADYTVWRDHLGDANGQPPVLDALVLMIDPSTGDARLWNGAGAPLSLIGYSLLSANASLLPGNGAWNSLGDQSIAGWEEAAPTASALSELNAAGATVLLPGESLALGAPFDLSAPHSGLTLEYVVEGADQVLLGFAVFTMDDPAIPLAPALKQAIAIDRVLSVDGGFEALAIEPAMGSLLLAEMSGTQRKQFQPMPLRPRLNENGGSLAIALQLAFLMNQRTDVSDHEEAFALLGNDSNDAEEMPVSNPDGLEPLASMSRASTGSR